MKFATSSRRRRHAVANLGYDLLNRPKTKAIPGRPDVTNGFDGAGNLVSYADGAPSATSYGYNAANQLTSVTDPAGTITITPDVNGRRHVVAFPNGVSASYGYTNAGQLKTVSYAGGTGLPANSTYSYAVGSTDTGAVQSRTLTSGSTTTYGYNTLGRLGSTSESSAAVTSYGYGYDNASNLVRKTSTTNGVSGSSCGRYTPTNSVDGTGSIAGTSCTGVVYSTTWSYDGAGNQTGSSSGWAESYNAKNQLTSATAPGASAVSMSYAGGTNAERIAVGGDNFTNGALGVTVRTTSSGTTRYTRAPDGTLLDERAASGTFYYLVGQLGSTEGLVDSTGATVASYSYDPYGNTLSATGTQAAGNPWRFAGGYYDIEGDGLTSSVSATTTAPATGPSRTALPGTSPSRAASTGTCTRMRMRRTTLTRPASLRLLQACWMCWRDWYSRRIYWLGDARSRSVHCRRASRCRYVRHGSHCFYLWSHLQFCCMLREGSGQA